MCTMRSATINTWPGLGASISPWVITLDVLKPFTCEPRHDHSANEFEYLNWKERPTGTFDIRLAASVVRKFAFLAFLLLPRD